MGEMTNVCFYEWNIRNFTCWNAEIHGRVIFSEKINNSQHIYIHPRGRIGHVIASITGCNERDLSIYGPDGSLLFKKEYNWEEEEDPEEWQPPGPMYDDVVARIRKDEALHGDRLTLRFSVISDYSCVLQSTIDVLETSLKLNPSDDIYRAITSLNYNSDDEGKSQSMYVRVSIVSGRLELALERTLPRDKIAVHTRVSVLDDEGCVVRTVGNERLVHPDEEFPWIFSDSLLTEEVKKSSILLNLKIVSRVKIKHDYCHYFSRPEDVGIAQNTVSDSPERSGLSKQLMCLYQEQNFSDFTFKCDNVSFPVHRNILSARSPVFKTMLSSGLREAKAGSMNIDELDSSTLGIFLTYLYTGTVENMQVESSLKLYYAADKYLVPTLKGKCAKFLCDNVSISNACCILSFANRHDDHNLTALARDFILENYNKVLASAEWKAFMTSEPFLVVQTLTLLGEKK